MIEEITALLIGILFGLVFGFIGGVASTKNAPADLEYCSECRRILDSLNSDRSHPGKCCSCAHCQWTKPKERKRAGEEP